MNYINQELADKIMNSNDYKFYVPLATKLKNILMCDVMVGINSEVECIALYNSLVDNWFYDIGALPKDTVAYKCISTKKEIHNVLNSRADVSLYRSSAVPIYDDNKHVIGCVVISTFLTKQQEILKLSETVLDYSNNIANHVSEVSEAMKTVTADNKNIQIVIEANHKQTEETDDVIELIKAVSKRTNLLGLNASIESARAGEFGRGFSVVATEIKKLSAETRNSIGKIENTLKNIGTNSKEIATRVTQSGEVYAVQTENLEQISTLSKELKALADKLKEIANQY